MRSVKLLNNGHAVHQLIATELVTEPVIVRHNEAGDANQFPARTNAILHYWYQLSQITQVNCTWVNFTWMTPLVITMRVKEFW